MTRFGKILLIISFLIVSLLADFKEYTKNIQNLRDLLQRKDILRKELSSINQELSNLPTENFNWFEKRKLSNLNKEKSAINEQILTLYKNIAEQKEKSYQDFHELFRENELSIIHTLQKLEDKQLSNRDSLLTHLLQLKEERDFLVYSQKYIVDINKNLLQPEFDDSILENVQSGVRKEFVALIQTKITNINTAIETAQKEKMMQEKLNDFRNEIAAVREPENVSLQNPILTSEKSYTDEAAYDNDLINFENSRAGAGMTANNYELVTSGSDFLILLENKEPAYINTFITEMDSLKQYYEKLLETIKE